jgi:hypothetical protein
MGQETCNHSALCYLTNASCRACDASFACTWMKMGQLTALPPLQRGTEVKLLYATRKNNSFRITKGSRGGHCRADALSRRKTLLTSVCTTGFVGQAAIADEKLELTGYKTFVSPESGFLFEYPEQWAVAIVRLFAHPLPRYGDHAQLLHVALCKTKTSDGEPPCLAA